MTSENFVTATNLELNYANDPEADALRKYASQSHAEVSTLLALIRSLLRGEKTATEGVISDLDASLIWLNQVSYVYRTIPSGTTTGRENVITKMLETVAQAHADVKVIKSWLRDNGAAILDEWNEERRLDKVLAELPPELRNEESRRLHRKPEHQ